MMIYNNIKLISVFTLDLFPPGRPRRLISPFPPTELLPLPPASLPPLSQQPLGNSPADHILGDGASASESLRKPAYLSGAESLLEGGEGYSIWGGFQGCDGYWRWLLSRDALRGLVLPGPLHGGGFGLVLDTRLAVLARGGRYRGGQRAGPRGYPLVGLVVVLFPAAGRRHLFLKKAIRYYYTLNTINTQR